MTVTVLTHSYEGQGSALELFRSRAPEVLLSGPAGTGKSRACLEKMHAFCLRRPGARALMVRKAASTLTSTGLVTYRQHVAPESIRAGHVTYYGGSAREPAQYRYSNDSVIVIGGMDKATKIMSSEYDMAYVQEAIELTENDWESITTRLRGTAASFTQLIADTNPSTPTHWLKQRCDRGQTLMLQSRHEENPTLFAPDGTITPGGTAYLARLDALTGVRHAIYRRGLWVAAEGIIYDDLDPAVHFIDPFTPQPEWPRYWSVDFGFTNPFVCQFWAEDPDGRAYLYREIYLSGRIVEDHAARILAIVAPNGQWIEPKPTRILADHDAEGRETFRKHLGLSTTAANKTVTTGIQAVQTRLRPAADGRPRLFIMRGITDQVDQKMVDAKKPTSTMDELPGYIWDVGAGKQPKETPLKENDHGADALRYYVADRDLGGTYRVRFAG